MRIRGFWMLAAAAFVALALATAATAAEVDTTGFCWFAGQNAATFVCESEFTGNSTLVRNNAGLTLTVDASGVTPGSAVTLWWVICEDDCNTFFFTYGAGHVVGSDGSANFAAHLQANKEVFFPDGTPAMLTDPLGAWVFPVLRTHGPMIPALVAEQTQTFDGGCNPGQPNEGLCMDIQGSAHYP